MDLRHVRFIARVNFEGVVSPKRNHVATVVEREVVEGRRLVE